MEAAGLQRGSKEEKMEKFWNVLIMALKQFWACLAGTGVTGNLAAEEVKYVRFTNVVTVLTAIGVILYIPQSLFKGYYLLTALQTVDALCVLAVLWLNARGYHKAARHTYFLVINVFVLINSCFIGHASGVYDFFYISYVIPFLLFKVRDYKHIIAGVAIPVICYNIYNHIFPYFVQYNVDLNTQHDIYQVNSWMKFILFGLAIYILAYYNFSTEKELAASNDKLKAQAEELKRSNEDLEQFAYIISHDLKAPVRNISSLMAMLNKYFGEGLNPGAKNIVQLSHTSAERLTLQIEDLLNYCKVDRNLPPATEVNLDAMIKTIRIELAEKIKEKHATVKVARPLPVVSGVHSNMLHHVFQNLVSNGIKFNTGNNAQVVIDYTETGGTLTFSVADNGIGIQEEYKNKLFQMFRRLHTAEEFEGSGIGLALCKKIINFYAGSIWLESRYGQGTTFYFTLPKPYITDAPPRAETRRHLPNVQEAA